MIGYRETENSCAGSTHSAN